MDGYVKRKWDDKDSDKVNDICHQIRRKIVNIAKENDLVIAYGKLDGIQDDDKGKEMKKRLHSSPH